MIESITIKKVASFCDIGIQINNLQKVNFIYGANGSGKTTISNLLSNPSDANFSFCAIKWKNDFLLSVLAYNKQFREANFGTGKIPGVFTLGQATKEEIAKIEEMQSQLKILKDNGLQKKATIENQTQTKNEKLAIFQETCWTSIYKKNESKFKEAFKGVSNSKVVFANKVIEQHNSNNQAVKTIDELQEKAKTLFDKEPQRVDEITQIDFTRLNEIENNTIWKKKIIGKEDIAIANLIQRLNLNDWVNQGKQLMENGSNICPFCQQKTIDENFRKQLDDYFDKTFVEETDLVKTLSNEYFATFQNIINLLQNIENKQKEDKSSKLNIDFFTSALRTINSQFVSNKELINNKIKEPSRSIELVSTKEQLESIATLILNANDEITKHNLLVTNYQREKSHLISDVWKFLIEENKPQIESFVREDNGLKTGIEKLENERKQLLADYKNLENEIKKANKNVTSIQASVDEITRILVAYGFTNFKIVPFENNQYQIQRENGQIADNTLSEGEITFITFLYFMQLAKGGTSAEKANEDRVLIIDDPISSLDSTILFVVSSAIKEFIKSIKKGENNIKQIIVLTHNVYFHKEITFFDRRDNNNELSYWILRKKNNISSIQHFENKNPIRGTYELLWDELKQKDKLSNITIQNTMRRILETYFKTMGKFTDDNLINSFQTKEEQEVCRSLICWVNDGSHCIQDDIHVEHQETINDKYYDVFQKVFENMKHIEHYNMMMKIDLEQNNHI